MTGVSTRRVAMAGVLIWAIVATFSWWPARADVRTDDRNGDRRPDVWRTYDRAGQVVERAIDSNFDGRSDVHEYYLHGALVHRESDRNFDDRVDLVEDFDATTHEHVRSVVDSDFDGIADLLVLFQAGRPVFSKWAPRSFREGEGAEREGLDRRGGAIPSRRGNAPIARLSDPFTSDFALRSAPIGSETPEKVWTAAGLPTTPAPTRSEIRAAWPAHGFNANPLSKSVVGTRSPRGPPSCERRSA